MRELNNKSNRIAALHYASMGWFIFPINPRTRQPLVFWKSEASNDPVRIQYWWSRWPAASIAVACEPSGLVVVDVDSPFAVTLFRRDYRTLEAATSRGAHFFFKGSTRSTVKVLGEYIDTRSIGAWVIAPPSLHWKTGRRYAWANDLPLADFPQELSERLVGERCALASNKEKKGEEAEKTHGFVPHGQRERQLLRTACAMAYRGEGHDAILKELRRVFKKFCEQVPSDPVDLERLTQQAIKYATTKPAFGGPVSRAVSMIP